MSSRNFISIMLSAKFQWFSVFPSVTTTTTVVAIISLVLASSFKITAATTEMHSTTVNSNQSQPQNGSNIQTRSPPPPKSLFNSQLFQQSDNLLGGVMKTFINSLPIRESYIAFEQGHPADTSSSQEYDQYFKPNRFPGLNYDPPPSPNYYNNKLQNSYNSYSPPPHPSLPPSFYQHQPQQSPYYMPPFSPHPPPPPPPPSPNQFLRMVKIPGDLYVNVSSGGWINEFQVICEFPPYLLIVQQIYWHFIPPPISLLLPYGTFYDSNNGFAPHVTVKSISKWKSILTVRDYTPDDYGTYRCVSTAILPEEPEPTYSVQLPHIPIPPTPSSSLPFDYPHPPHHHPPPYHSPPHYPPPHHHHPHHESIELRSAASTLSSARQLADNVVQMENEDSMASASEQREGKIKFLDRRKREAGAFGVHAPFFKPQYGIYRIFKEIRFGFGEPYGSGSDVAENTLKNTQGKLETKVNVGSGSTGGNNSNKGSSSSSSSGGIRDNESKQRKNKSGRAFENPFNRQSKVLF